MQGLLTAILQIGGDELHLTFLFPKPSFARQNFKVLPLNVRVDHQLRGAGRGVPTADQKRGLSALNLSRTLEDSATLTSALVPWNTCGAYMAATLGVSTLAYAPFTFFNYFCPIIAVIYGYLKIAQKPLEPELQQELEAEAGAV